MLFVFLCLLIFWYLTSNSGAPAVKIMKEKGWAPGQALGLTIRALDPPSPFAAITHPETFATAASTLATKSISISERLQRDRQGMLLPVAFVPGPVMQEQCAVLTWQHIAEGMVTMTEYAFSELGQVHEWDSANARWVQEIFHWTHFHSQMTQLDCLPRELQLGMHSAGTGQKWVETMQTLRNHRTYFWKWDDNYSKVYLRHVGALWKTLELAMNQAKLDLDFCFFFCSAVMDLLAAVDSGGMTFVPVLGNTGSQGTAGSSSASAQRLTFQARVRYRAQGRVAAQRYRTLTRHQANSISLLRPNLAARGVLPGAPSSSARVFRRR